MSHWQSQQILMSLGTGLILVACAASKPKVTKAPPTPTVTPVAIAISASPTPTPLATVQLDIGAAPGQRAFAQQMMGEANFATAEKGAIAAKPEEIATMPSFCQSLLPLPSNKEVTPEKRYPSQPIVAEVANGVYSVSGAVNLGSTTGLRNYTCVIRSDASGIHSIWNVIR